MSAAEQERLFGAGRADLFRRGVITQRDLVAQDGRFLTLEELRAAHVSQETQIALWWRKPRGEIRVGRVPPVVAESMGAKTGDVLLTPYTRKKQATRHPELTPEDYAKLPTLLSDPAEHFPAGKARHVAVISYAGALWVSIIKSDAEGRAFLLSFRRTAQSDIDRLRRKSKKGTPR